MMKASGAGTVIADLLIPFCEGVSINIKDVSKTIRKRFLVSLSFADNVELHKRLFKEQHIDWNGVQDYLQDIVYTPNDWMHLIRLLDFIQVLFHCADLILAKSNLLFLFLFLKGNATAIGDRGSRQRGHCRIANCCIPK